MLSFCHILRTEGVSIVDCNKPRTSIGSRLIPPASATREEAFEDGSTFYAIQLRHDGGFWRVEDKSVAAVNHVVAYCSERWLRLPGVRSVDKNDNQPVMLAQ